MGCGQSKLEEELAVKHCRERSELLASAIRHRYALADAHRAYADSLARVGDALHNFVRGVQTLPPPPPEPTLHLPPGNRKGDGLPAASPANNPGGRGPQSPPPPTARRRRPSPSRSASTPTTSTSTSTPTGTPIPRTATSSSTPTTRPTRPSAAPRSFGPPGSRRARGRRSTARPRTARRRRMVLLRGTGMDTPLHLTTAAWEAPAADPGYGGMGAPEAMDRDTAAWDHRHPVVMAMTHRATAALLAMARASSTIPVASPHRRPFHTSTGRRPPTPRSRPSSTSATRVVSHRRRPYRLSNARRPVMLRFRPSSIPAMRGTAPPPSAGYEQRPQASDARVHYYGDGGAQPPPRGYNGYAAPPQSSYNQYAYGGYYGGAAAPPPADMPSTSREEAAPPPPPSPPRVSTWDLNPFETYGSYYEQPAAAPTPYTPSRSSKDVREEEGIPDLEDEDMEVVKAYGDDKHPNGYSGKGKAAKEEVEKSVVGEQVQRTEARQHVAGLPPTGSEKTYVDDNEVVLEIKAQFERASSSAGEVSKMLEVGKMPYYQKSSGFKVVSAMMICGIPTMEEEFLRFEEDKAMGCGNLSSTLQKLYMWERKLLQEVKAEEEERLKYDRKRQDLQILDEKISKLRDDELWPQTCELIQGLMRMWDVMLECHQIQLHAISQAKNIDSMIDTARFGEDHMALIKSLELQLLDWTTCFAGWVAAQKNYVVAAFSWTVRCTVICTIGRMSSTSGTGVKAKQQLQSSLEYF
ncbi:hypothetical protein ZWY2020_036867 [Hordeum vulgare]|nr:hypothetical protein ZWY2020_036867 [Hordeum vulgare]